MVKIFRKIAGTALGIAIGATPLSAEPGDNNYGRDSDFSFPAVVEKEYEGLEKITTFECASNRPEAELNGVIHTYDIWRDGDQLFVSETGKPNVRFGFVGYWDIDGDGKFGPTEMEAMEKGYLNQMHGDFAKAFYAALTEVLDSRKAQPPEDSFADDYNRVAFLLDVFGGKGSKYTGLGVTWEPSRHYGFAATAIAGLGKNKLLEEVTTEPSPSGIYGRGTIEQEATKMLGGALDFKFGGSGFYGSIGAGLIYKNWIEKNTAEIRGPDGQVIKSNQDFISNSNVSPSLRLGLEYVTNSGIGIGVLANVEKNQVSFGGRISYGPIRKTQHKGGN